MLNIMFPGAPLPSLNNDKAWATLLSLRDWMIFARFDLMWLGEPPFFWQPLTKTLPSLSARFIGELIVGMLLGFVVRSALPEGIIEAHRYLELFIPIFVAIGEY